LKNVDFGRSRADATGSNGIGYTVLDYAGNIVVPRTTSSIYQTAPGIYASDITFPDRFNGQVLWDTGTAFTAVSYATEQYNVEENDPRVSDTWNMVSSMTGSIKALYDMSYGRWKIVNNQMLFYAPDNVTLVATFNLFDDSGTPSMDAVFERQRA